MTEKTLTTENIRPALDALRGELAPWPVVAMKQDRLNDTQKSAVNSGITSGLVAQIIANTAAIRALESAITGTGLRPLIVASLPAIGTQGILYIVPVTTYDPATDADVVNYSNEYIWIVAPDAPVTEGYYEQVGRTGIVINDGQLTITVNGTSVGTFTANQSGDTTAAITVPTNADYVDKTTDQSAAGVKTFSDGIVSNVTGNVTGDLTGNVTGDLTGTASKAIADEDGTSIKTGYVNVAGNQTVSGQKTWSGNQFFTTGVYHRNNSYEIGNTPASNVVIPIYFSDKNNANTGYIRNVILATGKTQSELYARNKFTSGALSPTGTDVTSTLQVEVQSNGDKTLYFDGSIRNNVLPYTTNTYTLGSSSYQWSAVYAQTYYYNGTAWGLDKSNTWTGVNTFSIATAESVAVKHTTYKGAILFRTNGVSNFKNYNTFFKWDISGYDNTFGLYRSVGVLGDTTTGATDEDIDTSFSLWKAHIRNKSLDFTDSVRAINDGTENSLKPITTSVTDLGTSSNQWKSVYAQTYYYNGTAWGLDKANVWTGGNTFSGATNCVLTFKFGTSGSYNDIRYSDNNNSVYACLRSKVTDLTLGVKYSSASAWYNGASVVISNNGNVQIKSYDGTENWTVNFTPVGVYPTPDNALDLGTPTNQWKSLNGINPGALSLPDFTSETGVSLSAGANTYTPTFSGWLSINTTGDISVVCGNFCHKATDMISVPVIAGKTYTVTMPASATGYFYPCLGNV